MRAEMGGAVLRRRAVYLLHEGWLSVAHAVVWVVLRGVLSKCCTAGEC